MLQPHQKDSCIIRAHVFTCVDGHFAADKVLRFNYRYLRDFSEAPRRTRMPHSLYRTMKKYKQFLVERKDSPWRGGGIDVAVYIGKSQVSWDRINEYRHSTKRLAREIVQLVEAIPDMRFEPIRLLSVDEKGAPVEKLCTLFEFDLATKCESRYDRPDLHPEYISDIHIVGIGNRYFRKRGANRSFTAFDVLGVYDYVRLGVRDKLFDAFSKVSPDFETGIIDIILEQCADQFKSPLPKFMFYDNETGVESWEESEWGISPCGYIEIAPVAAVRSKWVRNAEAMGFRVAEKSLVPVW